MDNNNNYNPYTNPSSANEHEDNFNNYRQDTTYQVPPKKKSAFAGFGST